MTLNLLDLTGAITAPAGCGKTQLVADAAANHTGSRPLLLLTHTNAGVTAMRNRLAKAKVPAGRARVATLDGWSIGLISRFPARSGHKPSLLEIRGGDDYSAIRNHALELVEAGHIDNILAASYDRIIVDEYQDCGARQHQLVTRLSKVVPTVVLGDPLQAIFDFKEPVVHWENEVRPTFGDAGTLDKPWRWINTNNQELGEWLLFIRETLANEKKIDLETAPQAVQWIRLKSSGDDEARRSAAAAEPPIPGGSVLVVGDSYAKNHDYYARATDAHVVENVNLGPLIQFADGFDLSAQDALSTLLTAAGGLVSGTNSVQLKERVEVILAGGVPTSAIEEAATRFSREASYAGALEVLRECSRLKGARVHRPAVFEALTAALRLAQGGVELGIAARRLREEARFRGRQLSTRSVGSTLLLKGLEADAVVVLNPEAMTRRNLYVAMTRGSRRLSLCSVGRMV